MKTHSTLTLLTCLGFAGLSPVPLEGKPSKKPAAAASHKKGKAHTAQSLVNDMGNAVVYIVQQSEPINDKAKQTKPYWQGLSDTWDGLDLMEDGIAKKNSNMLKGLENVGRGLTQRAAQIRKANLMRSRVQAVVVECQLRQRGIFTPQRGSAACSAGQFVVRALARPEASDHGRKAPPRSASHSDAGGERQTSTHRQRGRPNRTCDSPAIEGKRMNPIILPPDHLRLSDDSTCQAHDLEASTERQKRTP